MSDSDGLTPRGLALVLALSLAGPAALAACNADQTGGTPWSYSADADSPDGDDGDATDTGDGRRVEATGWYRSGFESSLFTRSADLNISTGGSPPSCQVAAAAQGEEWWVGGSLPFDPLYVFNGANQRRPKIAKIRAEGRITPKGSYGHLGDYDRRFEVDRADVKACATFEELGDCVVPRASDRCLQGARDDPPDEFTFGRTQTRGPATHELVARWTGRAVDRFVEVRMTLPLQGSTDDEAPWTRQAHGDAPAGTQLREEVRGTGSDRSTEFGNVSGWIRTYRDDGDQQPLTVRLSLHGTDPDRGELHIWGTFPVGTKSW